MFAKRVPKSTEEKKETDESRSWKRFTEDFDFMVQKAFGPELQILRAPSVPVDDVACRDPTTAPTNLPVEFDISLTPKAGVWDGFPLHFEVNVPAKYPAEPPHILYIGPHRILHPNISMFPQVRTLQQTNAFAAEKPEQKPQEAGTKPLPQEEPETDTRYVGHICLNILQKDFKPSFKLHDYCLGVLWMLSEPNFDDALGGTAKLAVELYRKDPKSWEETAKKWASGSQTDPFPFGY